MDIYLSQNKEKKMEEIKSMVLIDDSVDNLKIVGKKFTGLLSINWIE